MYCNNNFGTKCEYTTEALLAMKGLPKTVWWGQVFGTVAKPLLGTSASHVGVQFSAVPLPI